MRIRIFDSKEECFEAAASVWVNYAIAHPTSIIGCCTGTTTGPIHQLVVEKYKKRYVQPAHRQRGSIRDPQSLPQKAYHVPLHAPPLRGPGPG